MQYEYFIFENMCASSDLNRTIPAQILKMPTHIYKIDFAKGDGGYKTIKELRQKSQIFKNIARTNSKHANKILDPKNIKTVKDYHFDNVGSSYSGDYIGVFDHILRGHIKKKNIQGLHIFDPLRMRVEEFGKMNPESLVWEAKISKYDIELERWITKDRMSNFFPIHCSSQCLFKQCCYAYDNKVKVEGTKSKYESQTKCGIPITIIVDENTGKTKTMYPDLDYNN